MYLEQEKHMFQTALTKLLHSLSSAMISTWLQTCLLYKD